MSGIPPITPYPMPTGSDQPENTVRWRPEPERAVLLVHDMQRYFVRPFLAGEEPGDSLLRNCAMLRTACADLGMPVVFTAQPGDMTPEQRGLLRDFWGPGMAATPADREIVTELAPAPGDWRLVKWRYSAFVRSDLLRRLRDAGRDQLVIVGVYASIGVLSTALDAFAHDIQAFLVADAVADFDERHHRMALAHAAERCAMVVTTKETLDALHETEGAR